jgi:hypothetical protein
MLRRIRYLLPLAAMLAVGLPAPSSHAAVAYRTVSQTATICEPQPLESTVTFSDFNAGPVRLATTAPVVVQTGVRPYFGPDLPVSLLTGTTGDVLGPGGPQGYHFRAFDQSGATVASRPRPDRCFTYAYHASIPFTDAARSAGAVSVTTDARGIATVRFPRPLATAPVSVIVTGSSPYIGPGLPVNLISMAYSATGFTVRALDQAGSPIANHAIRLDYWATIQAATPNTRAGSAVITPDSRGFGFVPWPKLAVCLPPISVVLTGVTPQLGPNMPVNLVAYGFNCNGAGIRVLNQAGQPVTTPVRIAFYATKAGVSSL